MDKSKKLYELAYLISPACSEDEANGVQQSAKNIVAESGGLIDQVAGGEGNVSKRRLFYPIQKSREAYLAYFRFTLEKEKAEEIKSIKSKIENKKEIIRVLLIETKHIPERHRIIRQQPRLEETKSEALELAPAANEAEIDKKLEEILGK